MSKHDNELKKLKKDLESGAIDISTYNKITEKLNDNYMPYSNKIKLPKDKKRIKLLNILKLVLIVLILVIVFYYIFISIPFHSYQTVTDLYNLPQPLQQSTNGYVVKYISGTPVNISYIAKYTIQGVVLDTYDYLEYNTQNKLSPIDVALGWGTLANPNNYSKVNWSSSGNRFLYHRITDYSLLNTMSESYLDDHFSNNHLIPSSNEIKKLIKSIKKGDYISIEGYLVNATYKKEDNYMFYWNSSTSRTDSGDGACELIYVIDIKWLKEAKN